jgi:hypothetical protein
VIIAFLYRDGNRPWLNERFARLEMIIENDLGHALMIADGNESADDNLIRVVERSFVTSAGVTGEKVVSLGSE